MHQDHDTFNGSTALVLYKLGRLEVMAETTQHEVRETRADMQGLTRRLDTLEKGSLRDALLDMSGWVVGLAVLVLAAAGRWQELLAFLEAVGR